MSKVALITGASRGLGREIVREFAKNGVDVIINYHTETKKAEELALEVTNKYHVKAIAIKCDISREQEVKTMFNQIEKEFGKIDYVINNAAIANDGIFLDKTSEDFMKVYQTNLVGAFLCSKYAAKIMPPSGAIINISSTNGIDTNYTYSADYDCSKAALISLTNNLAIELAPIRVNAIAPGWINTDMNSELDSEYIKEERKKILLKRFAEVSEIAKVVTFLCSSDASYINKSVIRVDGGYNG